MSEMVIQVKKIISPRIVIGAHAGGLGDNLLFSTLPELYTRAGYEVYVSTEPTFRNMETYELVWRHNPFILGRTEEKANAGGWVFDRPGNAHVKMAKFTDSPISSIEKLHGFEGRGKYPKIYYRPKFLPEWNNKIIADPRSISQQTTQKMFHEFILHVSRYNEINHVDIVVLESKHSGQSGSDCLPENDRYQVSTIFEYADIIFSCKAFLVAESGGQVLASAIKGCNEFPKVFGLHTTQSKNDRIFTMPNIDICVTGCSNLLDYHPW